MGGPKTAQGAEYYRLSATVLEEARRDSLIYGDEYDARQEAEGKPIAVRLERAELYLNLGLAYNGLGKFKVARDQFIYGRKLGPANLVLYGALAGNYLDGGNPAWAAVTLQEKLMLDGGTPRTVDTLRQVLAKIPGSSCVFAGRRRQDEAERRLSRN